MLVYPPLPAPFGNCFLLLVPSLTLPSFRKRHSRRTGSKINNLGVATERKLSGKLGNKEKRKQRGKTEENVRQVSKRLQVKCSLT